ncbi:hypothetical protein [Streptomyces sp. NPDC004728]|uniref:hypothetical protein n=1 Tax=Streptomyces sp. NPDC004728 TaxID=3154289 RepID=UPI00339DE02F
MTSRWRASGRTVSGGRRSPPSYPWCWPTGLRLRRCLNDTTLPLEVRIAAALTRLYALPVFRAVRLTATGRRAVLAAGRLAGLGAGCGLASLVHRRLGHART